MGHRISFSMSSTMIRLYHINWIWNIPGRKEISIVKYFFWKCSDQSKSFLKGFFPFYRLQSNFSYIFIFIIPIKHIIVVKVSNCIVLCKVLAKRPFSPHMQFYLTEIIVLTPVIYSSKQLVFMNKYISQWSTYPYKYAYMYTFCKRPHKQGVRQSLGEPTMSPKSRRDHLLGSALP